MYLKSSAVNWYVAYTMNRSEKKVANELSRNGVEAFLPICKVVKHWSDRKVTREVPLFPNYIFIKVDNVRRVYSLSVKGIVNFVVSERKPVIIRETEIEAIKNVLNRDLDPSPDDYFHVGDKVKITYGQFAGLEGYVVRRNGKCRLSVKIDSLMKAFSFNLPAEYLKPMITLHSASSRTFYLEKC